MTRAPMPDTPVQPGYEYVAVREDPDKWHVLSRHDDRLCRMHGCRRPAKAEFARLTWNNKALTQHFRWWAYCGRHLYGRWIEDGQVMCWRLMRSEDLSHE